MDDPPTPPSISELPFQEDTPHATYPAPRDEADRPNRMVSCYFTPVVGTQQEYEDFFRSEHFDNYTDINLRVKDGFVRFATRAEVDLFVDHFSNMTFKGQKMRVEKSRPQASGCKTLHLSGFSAGAISERAIYERFLDFGFIRRVAVKRDFAFVEFDTAEEAQGVMRLVRTVNIDGEMIRVAFARTEHKVDPQNLTIPLKELIPLDHPFWYQLQDKLYDAPPHVFQ
jgi:RNA recognition motif-containing protein